MSSERGVVGRDWDSWFQDCKFEPHVGQRDYVNKGKKLKR